MDLDQQLDKARTEINRGLKNKAANRLRNVMNTYHDAMAAREMLAKMYYDSGFLDMAGRYWMLTESDETHLRKSIDIYVKSVNYSSEQILNDIKYRGDKSGLTDYARNKLITLENDVKDSKRGNRYTSGKNNKSSNYKNIFADKVVSILFISIIILLILFIIVGAIVSVKFVIQLF